MKKLFTIILLIALIICSTACSAISPNDITYQNNECEVIRVVDGDTIIVDYNNDEIRVRFIGVNTPESVSPDEKRNCEEGKDASQFTKELLTGKTVELEFDEERYDQYGRTLAYVYLDGVMINELLLTKGLARTMFYEPNTRYKEKFLSLEETAQTNDIGFWGTIWQ